MTMALETENTQAFFGKEREKKMSILYKIMAIAAILYRGPCVVGWHTSEQNTVH